MSTKSEYEHHDDGSRGRLDGSSSHTDRGRAEAAASSRARRGAAVHSQVVSDRSGAREVGAVAGAICRAARRIRRTLQDWEQGRREHRLATFIDGGWDGRAAAKAVAGSETASAGSGFIEGAIVYSLGEKGLMASADISGTRFWVDDRPN